MSPELKAFYKSVQDWIDSNFTVNPYEYMIWAGLCLNSGNYEYIHNLKDEILGLEMRDQFVAEQLDPEVPFNTFPNIPYDQEARQGIIWQNPKRLEWVKQHAKTV